MEEVVDWFTQNGGKLHTSIKAEKNDEFGLYFVASKDIPEGESASFCPFELTFSYLNCLSQPPQGVRRIESNVAFHLIELVDPNVVAAFVLVEERLKEDKSFWAPYIKLLPKESELSTPLWFTDEELIWLQGTNLCSSLVPKDQTAIGQRKASYRESWEHATNILRSHDVDTLMFTW
jgi:hypothetical protein